MRVTTAAGTLFASGAGVPVASGAGLPVESGASSSVEVGEGSVMAVKVCPSALVFAGGLLINYGVGERPVK